ncbi:hypothetical protein VIGAN_06003800, partial [Vigna angularis var. angularis]
VILIPSFPLSNFPSMRWCLWKGSSTIDTWRSSASLHTSSYKDGKEDTALLWWTRIFVSAVKVSKELLISTTSLPP